MNSSGPSSARLPIQATAELRRRAVLLRWGLLSTVAGLGWLAGTALLDGPVGGWSFLLGLTLAVAGFEFGAFNLRLGLRHLPGASLLVALFSYAVTVVALGLALLLLTPAQANGMSVAIGIFVGVAIWIGTEFERTRVRSLRP